MERKADFNFGLLRRAPLIAKKADARAFIFSEELGELHRLIAVVGELDLPLAYAGSLDGYGDTATSARRQSPQVAPAIALVCVDEAELDDSGFADRLGCLPQSARLVILARCKAMPQGLHQLPEGTVALLPASTSADRLVPVLKLVMDGFVVFPQDLMARDLPDTAAGDDPGAHVLTRRQREICQLVANGKSNKQIANHFGISVNTVNAHLQAIRLRLGVQNRTMIAIRTAQPNSRL